MFASPGTIKASSCFLWGMVAVPESLVLPIEKIARIPRSLLFVIYYEGTFEGIIIIKSVKIKINKVRSFVRLFVHSFIICS